VEEMKKDLVQTNRNCKNLKLETILTILITINFSQKPLPLYFDDIEKFALVSWLFNSKCS
jgi:hypothetical protein